MSFAGGILAIAAWLGLCLALCGFAYLIVLVCTPDHDPMQDESGDVPNVPGGF